jgi:hypothetical protein
MTYLSKQLTKSADPNEYRFWNDRCGWGSLENAEVYSDNYRYSTIPPKGGRWVRTTDVQTVVQEEFNKFLEHGIM